MKLIRYSHTGFVPQFQSHMKKQIDYALSWCIDDVKDLSEYVQTLVHKDVKSTRENLQKDFELWGIHVFFENTSPDEINHFLNHLMEIPPRHELNIGDQLMLGHSLHSPYTQVQLSLKTLQSCSYLGAYIPKSQLNMENFDVY